MATNNSTNIEMTPGGNATLTFPTASDTLVGRNTVDTLTNKNLTSPTNTLYDSRIMVTRLTSDAASNATVTGVKIGGLDTTVEAGTYEFHYVIVYQSSVAGTGVKFGVNSTSSANLFVANLRYQESTTAASTGAASQAAIGGTLHAGASTRTLSASTTNLGPTASVDTINVNMLAIIEGIIVIPSTGVMELWHASETAAATTVKAQTSLILTKLS